MNEIVKKFLIVGDKFMPKMYLKQPAAFDKSGCTYSAWGPFTKNKKRMQKFKETGDSQCIYQNELHKIWHGLWRF